MTRRVIDDVECVDRAEIGEMIGRGGGNPGDTVAHLATGDPTFPDPVRDGRPVDRKLWYPITVVQAYVDELAARREALKPPPADATGDPDELLDYRAAADVWHLTVPAMRRYLYRSVPQWAAGDPGLVPHPDTGRDRDQPDATTPKDWRWRRRTLVDHPRPGRGSSGGRPPANLPRATP